MNWSKKIVAARIACDLTQDELAKLIGEQSTRISKWERGVGTPSMLQGLALAKALGLSVEELADDNYELETSDAISRTTINKNYTIRSGGNLSAPPNSSNDDSLVHSLIKAIGSNEALRRLTSTSVVDVLPNPELIEIHWTSGRSVGPVRVNGPGMLEIGAFTVGKTTRVLFKSADQLREFANDLFATADSFEEQEREERWRKENPDGYPEELSTGKKGMEGLLERIEGAKKTLNPSSVPLPPVGSIDDAGDVRPKRKRNQA